MATVQSLKKKVDELKEEVREANKRIATLEQGARRTPAAKQEMPSPKTKERRPAWPIILIVIGGLLLIVSLIYTKHKDKLKEML